MKYSTMVAIAVAAATATLAGLAYHQSKSETAYPIGDMQMQVPAGSANTVSNPGYLGMLVP